MLEGLWDWIQAHSGLMATLLVSSLVLLILTAALLPLAIRLLPADYFVSEHRERQAPTKLPRPIYIAYLMGKNFLGVVFLIAGIAMLLLPGQGLLTILVALILLDFPGKFRLERRMVQSPWIRRVINWMRQRLGVPPFQIPPEPDQDP